MCHACVSNAWVCICADLQIIREQSAANNSGSTCSASRKHRTRSHPNRLCCTSWLSKIMCSQRHPNRYLFRFFVTSTRTICSHLSAPTSNWTFSARPKMCLPMSAQASCVLFTGPSSCCATVWRDPVTVPLLLYGALFVPTAFRDIPALAESLPHLQTIFQHLGKTARGNSNDACRTRATDPMAKPLVENILFLHFTVPDGRVSSCRVLFYLVLFAACSLGLTFTLAKKNRERTPRMKL